jgi:hypothetical protein
MIRFVDYHIPVEMIFARAALKPLLVFPKIRQLELGLELLCAE